MEQIRVNVLSLKKQSPSRWSQVGFSHSRSHGTTKWCSDDTDDTDDNNTELAGKQMSGELKTEAGKHIKWRICGRWMVVSLGDPSHWVGC